jgi:hypothetical protein
MEKTPAKFSVGEWVMYINENGVCWGVKKIIKHEWDEIRGNVYLHENSDTPWFMVSERNYFSLNNADVINEKLNVFAYRCKALRLTKVKTALKLGKSEKVENFKEFSKLSIYYPPHNHLTILNGELL